MPARQVQYHKLLSPCPASNVRAALCPVCVYWKQAQCNQIDHGRLFPAGRVNIEIWTPAPPTTRVTSPGLSCSTAATSSRRTRSGKRCGWRRLARNARSTRASSRRRSACATSATAMSAVPPSSTAPAARTWSRFGSPYLGVDQHAFWNEMERCFAELLAADEPPRGTPIREELIPEIHLEPPPESWPDPAAFLEHEDEQR